MSCPACAAPIPEGARFCPSCGHALVIRPDERRVATVLFADLVGFTTFSESADPEHVKNEVDSAFEHLAADVEAFGGRVDKIVGDAIVALFGAPVAHEDDAERAVRAGLRMQSTLARLREDHVVDAEMRIGVNTGEVLVGALRAGGDYTAMGDAVNVASRLQAVATPGTVLVGPATHAATRLGIAYEDLGPLAVRGREESVAAWQALRVLAPPGQRPARARTPLVGRDAELGVLATVLYNTVERERAHLVLLTGEAGVGKTRLAREIGRRATDEHGAVVLLGHCAPYGEANVWFPIAEVLRQACAIDVTDSADAARDKCHAAVVKATALPDDSAETARIEDGLLFLMGQSGPGVGVDPARARDDARRSLQSFLEGLASQQPVVLGISDLHWADDLVLELVEHLMERLRQLPVLLVATARPGLEDRWAPKAARHNAVFVHLDALDSDASAQLARALLGDDARPELVELLLERSGGNPFFIEELVAVLTERGDSSTGTELPVTLRGLVSARLDALDARPRATLADCAVIGASGSIELVHALAAARGDTEPDDSLRTLGSRDLVELSRDRYLFRSELVREVAYETLTKAERARRHVAVTHHLAERSAATGRVEEMLDALAHHYGASAAILAELGGVEGVPADLPDKALDFLTRAANRATDQEMWLVARRLLDMALKIAGPGDPRHLDLRLARARAHTELRELVEARGDLDAVLDDAQARDDARAIASALTVRGDIESKENDLTRADATLADAVARWREIGDPAGLAAALRRQGMTGIFRGDLEPAEAAIHAALDMYRSIGDRRGEASSLQHLAWIAFYRGNLTSAEARLDESATAFAEIGDWGGLGWALGLYAWVRFNQGNLDEAERLATQVLEEASELGNRWACGIMEVLLANVALWRGQMHDALQRARAATAIFRTLGDLWGELQAVAPTARALYALGRSDEGDAVLRSSDDTASGLQDADVGQFPWLLRAAIAVHVGKPNALALARAAIDRSDDSVTIAAELQTTYGLALLQAGVVDDALVALEQSCAATEEASAPSQVALALALAAAGRGADAGAALDATTPVTYLDRIQLLSVRALLAVDDAAGAVATVGELVAAADATDSPLDQALARLTRAHVWDVLGRVDATDARADAVARLERLGIDRSGWETAFRLATVTR